MATKISKGITAFLLCLFFCQALAAGTGTATANFDIKVTDNNGTTGIMISGFTRGFDDYYHLKTICQVLKIDYDYSSKNKRVVLSSGKRSCTVYLNNSNKLLPENPAMRESKLYVSRNGIAVILHKLLNADVKYVTPKKEFVVKGNIFTPSVKSKSEPPPAPLSDSRKKVVKEIKGEKFALKKIIIDAGHGGKDSGAVGPNKLQEKDVTLDIAKRLGELVLDRMEKEVVYTRPSDKYISLPERCYVANNSGGDIFVSIHMNASVSRSVSGTEIYIFGTQASDEGAKRQAIRENLDTPGFYDKAINLILGDIGKKSNENASILLAGFVEDEVIKNIGTEGRDNKKIMRAPFYVLANTTMPSVLVESAFITNENEEEKLKSPEYRQKIAEGICNGLQKFSEALENNEGETGKNTASAQSK